MIPLTTEVWEAGSSLSEKRPPVNFNGVEPSDGAVDCSLSLKSIWSANGRTFNESFHLVGIIWPSSGDSR